MARKYNHRCDRSDTDALGNAWTMHRELSDSCI